MKGITAIQTVRVIGWCGTPILAFMGFLLYHTGTTHCEATKPVTTLAGQKYHYGKSKKDGYYVWGSPATIPVNDDEPVQTISRCGSLYPPTGDLPVWDAFRGLDETQNTDEAYFVNENNAVAWIEKKCPTRGEPVESSGAATSSGENSPAVTGTGNTVTVNGRMVSR